MPYLPALAELYGVMPWHIEGPEHLTSRELELLVAVIEMRRQEGGS